MSKMVTMIRRGRMEDLEEIAFVESMCFSEAEAATKECFQERLKIYGKYFWLLLEGNRLISFVDGMVTDQQDLTDKMYEDATLHQENGEWQMIFGVNTLPQYRKRGYAEMLLRKVIEDTKSEGKKGLVLTCKEELKAFYGKLGFIDEGVSESVHGNAKWYQMRLLFSK